MALNPRRKFLGGSSAIALDAFLPAISLAATPSEVTHSELIAAWMTRWMDEKRAFKKPLELSRFVEPVYYLLKPNTWEPNTANSKHKPVTVPRGFVTDFASIPRAFWTALRPDGDYAHAAIVHDYLYWTQAVSKEAADDILKIAMQDLEVSPKVVTLIYEGVHRFGSQAWKQNQELKAKGEKRIMKRFPTNGNTRWEVWKQLPDVFGEM